MRRHALSLAQMGGLAACIVLPVWFNPLDAATPFEPSKVALFEILTGVAGLGVFAAWVLRIRTDTLQRQFRNGIQGLRLANPLALPVLAFAGVSILATLASIDWQQSLQGPGDNRHGLVMTLCLVTFFLLMVNVLKWRSQMDRFVQAILLGSIPVAFYGLAQYIGLDPLVWISNPISPSFSTMGNPNYLGAYLGLVAPFTLVQLVAAESGNKRGRYGLVMLLQLACLWLTLARGAWLSVVGGCFASLFVLGWRRQRRILVGASIVLVLLGAGVFAGMNTAVIRPLSGPSEASSRDAGLRIAKIDTASVQERLVIWRTTVSLLADRWVLGYGPGTFERVFSTRQPSEVDQFEGANVRVNDPHNFVLGLGVESGLAGLIAFAWIVLVFYRTLHAALANCREPQEQALVAGILGSGTAFLIQAQFNPTGVVLLALFWLSLAMAVAMYHKIIPRSSIYE